MRCSNGLPPASFNADCRPGTNPNNFPLPARLVHTASTIGKAELVRQMGEDFALDGDALTAVRKTIDTYIQCWLTQYLQVAQKNAEA